MCLSFSASLVKTRLQKRGLEQCDCSVVIRFDGTRLLWWQLEHTVESSEKVGIVVVDNLAHLEAGVPQGANKLIAIGESGTNLGELEYSTRFEHTPRFTHKSRPIGAHERETEHDDIDAGVSEGHMSKVSRLNVAIRISNQIKGTNLHRILATALSERGGKPRFAAAKISNKNSTTIVAMATPPNKERQLVSNAIQRIERPVDHLLSVGRVVRLKRRWFPLIAR